MAQAVDQIGAWRAAASRLGVEVVSPCEIQLSNGSRLSAGALVKVGPQRGVVVDPDWATLEPHADQLVADGYGYSAVMIEDDHSLIEMLRDWGWRPPDC